MTKRKPEIIKDKKKRGEWAESVFMARAGEHGLPVSTPWGEMCSYDFIIGKTGRFCSVQVKSTICQQKTGYDCTVRGGHKAYPAGSFDFLAAFVVPEDTWYIIPAKVIRGKTSITLIPESKTDTYEQYREAWHLLRAAAELGEDKKDEGCVEEPAAVPEPGRFPTSALGRMEAAANFVRRSFEGSAVRPQKERDDI
jgi:PD-(D/E)XK endonuclease